MTVDRYSLPCIQELLDSLPKGTLVLVIDDNKFLRFACAMFSCPFRVLSWITAFAFLCVPCVPCGSKFGAGNSSLHDELGNTVACWSSKEAVPFSESFLSLSALKNYPFILWLLGISPRDAKNIERMDLVWAASWVTWAIVLLLVGAVVWFGWLYYKDGTKPKWTIKAPLVLLRLIAVSALVIILQQPSLRLKQVGTIKPSVAILVDTSGSMAFTDLKLPASRAQIDTAATNLNNPGSVSRLERTNALLNQSKILQTLGAKYNVRLYTFAGDVKTVGLPTDAKARNVYRFALTPDTKNTDRTQMGDALRRPLEELAGQPLAGALVISDGGSNLGEDPILAADASKQAGLKISTLGFGDPTKTKDIALLSVLADDIVRTNNTVTVYAALSQRGYAGKSVSVRLLRGNELVQSMAVKFGADGQKQEVRFNYTAGNAGKYGYRVVVSSLPGETTQNNNVRGFEQTVISKKLRVLYVEELPRYEYRYLKNAILRDTSLEFACLLLSADEPSEGNIPLSGFPKTEKELFNYDIVILGDVPRSAFSETQLESLRRFVEDRGASLLTIAGENHVPHEYAGTPLEAVLPVAFNSIPDPVITEDAFQWQLTPEGKRSSVTLLEDNANQNAQVWERLPGMFWSAGVERVKPGATVLAVHPTRRNAEGNYPLVAVQPFGSGRSFIQLVDSTWRWRWRVGDRHFYRYWGQVLRSLTPKEIPGNSRYVQINADRSNYVLGDKVILSARLLDEYYRPLKRENAAATLKLPTGQTQAITLKAAPNSPGLFTAEIVPDRTGRYEATLISPANPSARASTSYLVESLSLERQKPELDEILLRKVAAAGGGKYYTPDKLNDWIKSLSNNPLKVGSETETELWNAPLLFFLFLLPLALEWFIRKRTGLL